MAGNTSEITNLLQHQSDKIFWLWVILIAVAVVMITFLILYFVNRHNKNILRVGIHMPGEKVLWFTIKHPKQMMRIDHGKKPNGDRDIFYYMYDQSCQVEQKDAYLINKNKNKYGFWDIRRMFVKTPDELIKGTTEYKLNILETQKSRRIIQYYYRNPNPILFKPDFKGFPVKTGTITTTDGKTRDRIEYRGRTLATIKEQNLDVPLESDAIQKFVLAKQILSTIFTFLVIVIIITAINLLITGWDKFASGDNTCVLQPDNTTINTIYIGSHLTPTSTTPNKNPGTGGAYPQPIPR